VSRAGHHSSCAPPCAPFWSGPSPSPLAA